MILLLPGAISLRLKEALLAGGRREIGGIVMGEHVSAETFRVVDITVQMTGGTFATFVRVVDHLLAPLRRFFRDTNHQYTRFNYLGEWHSHHSFALAPSSTDNATMIAMLADRRLGARFLILLLAQLGQATDLHCALVVYESGRAPYGGEVRPE
jgi:hypothetical protein